MFPPQEIAPGNWNEITILLSASAFYQPCPDNFMDSPYPIGQRRRSRLQDVGRLDLMELLFLYCRNFIPTRARRDALGPELLAARGTNDHVWVPSDDFVRVRNYPALRFFR